MSAYTATNIASSNSSGSVLPALGFEAGAVAICNKALSYLGGTQILSFTQKNREAELCAAHFASVRDECLELHPWSFAQRMQTLAMLPKNEANKGQMPPSLLYAFALPTDCLRLRYVFGRPLYVLEGRVLHSDLAKILVSMTVRIEDTSIMPPLFREVIARRLAADLAIALLNNPRLEQIMQQRLAEALSAAKLADALEDGCKAGFEEALGLDSFENAFGSRLESLDSWFAVR